MARIELSNVSKRWEEVVALEPTDLVIENGEFVALLGPSGCGKSTTLLMLAGIYRPTTGTIKFDGHVVNDVEAKDRDVGIVFQSYALYPHMTVRENIQFPLRFKGISKSEAEQRIKDVARMVRVEDLLDRRPSQISGGQQQRVALARALVKRPQFLLLDEPLSNLDATLRIVMRAEIRHLQREIGVTTILVTHDQIEATTMADRVVCMSKGRVEQVGTPQELYLRPNNIFIASFVGAPQINLVHGHAHGDVVSVRDRILRGAGLAAGAVTIGLRPEHLSFAEDGLPGRIGDVEMMGREMLYFIETDMGTLRLLEAGTAPRFAAGEAIHLTFDAADSLVFSRENGALIPDAHVFLSIGAN
ncbi:MAG: ABC transporter ATP-binding protein [Gammaproteobacteria bacterium]|nr:ABC transporter ATP-binding protein [Gammaproteobacteria bacterium]